MQVRITTRGLFQLSLQLIFVKFNAKSDCEFQKRFQSLWCFLQVREVEEVHIN